MKKIAVITSGFEEGEALTTVDILRRGQIQFNIIVFLTNVSSASSLTLIGYLYGFTKSYQVVFIIALFFHFINLILLLVICSRYNNKGDRNEIL